MAALTSVATDEWIYLWPKPDNDPHDLSADLAPAMAWQYALNVEARIELPAYGAGPYVGTTFLEAHTTGWALELYDPNWTAGTADDQVDFWGEGIDWGDGGGCYYKDQVNGLHQFEGIIQSLGAGVYLIQWTYGNEARIVMVPSPCLQQPGWLGPETLAGGVNERGTEYLWDLAYIKPAQDSTAIAESWTIGFEWRSPVVWASLGAGLKWRLQFTSSFPWSSYSLKMRRIPTGSGGAANLSPDSLLHTVKPGSTFGTSIVEEVRGGGRVWSPRRKKPLPVMAATVQREKNGSLFCMGLSGNKTLIYRSPDEGTTWVQWAEMPGGMIPMHFIIDQDGVKHILRYDGSALRYERMGAITGTVTYRKTITRTRLLSATIQKRGNKLVVFVTTTGGVGTEFVSEDGIEWREAEHHVSRT